MQHHRIAVCPPSPPRPPSHTELLIMMLAELMEDARRLAADVAAAARHSADGGAHPLVAAVARMAQNRQLLDPEFGVVLGKLVAGLARSIANGVEDQPDAAVSIVDLHDRAVELHDGIERVLDRVMAEAAIHEARFWPLRD